VISALPPIFKLIQLFRRIYEKKKIEFKEKYDLIKFAFTFTYLTNAYMSKYVYQQNTTE